MRKNLSPKELLIMGGGLFSMHFGAICLLYPVTWGNDAGAAVWSAYLGIFLSGIVLPFLGYVALVKGRGNFLDITRRASPVFGLFFVAATILVLGPFFVIPRVTAALWAAVLQLTGWRPVGKTAVLLFNGAFYAVIYTFVASSGKVIERIGRILFPVLMVIVVSVIVQSIAAPISPSWVKPSFDENPVVHGFLAGYAAGDLQCALMYGLVVVRGIHNAGIAGGDVNRNLIKIGVIGMGLLALAHLGHMIAGANIGGTIHLNLAALYVQMVVELWGPAGGSVFLVALATASLTAAIGITSSTAGIWEKILRGRASYRRICAASCVISGLVSSTGIDTIVTVVGPVLDACYPSAIVITFFYCFCRRSNSRRNLFALKCAMIAGAVMGGAALLNVYVGLFRLDLPRFSGFYAALPLSASSLAWIPVSIAAYAAAWLCAARLKGEVNVDGLEIE